MRSMFGRLEAEVELAAQRRGEVLDDGGQVDELPEDGPVGRPLGEHLEQAEVAVDVGRGARPLYLDDDPRPALERRPVHLPDGAGGHRHRLDRVEDVLPGHAQLLAP